MNKNSIDLAKKFAERRFIEAGVKNHFLEVFDILQNEFLVNDQDILIAGILHDTLEDTFTTTKELEEIFSKKISILVEEVSHPKNYNQKERLEYYEKIKTISPEAKLIKLADFTSHLRSFIKIYQKGEQYLYPKFINNDKYISQIRDFLKTCKDLPSKNIVLELTNNLETLL